MKRYRADIFDRQFNFKDMAQTSNPNLVVDYLVLEKSICQFPRVLNVARGDYIIVRGDGLTFYGVVVDFEYAENIQTVYFEQLTKLFDTEVFLDSNQLRRLSIEQWLANALYSVYQGTDTFQNLTGFQTVVTSSTTGTYQYSDDGVYNLFDLLVHFFKVNGVVCDVALDVQNKRITFTFRAIGPTVWKLETTVSDVLDYSIVSSSTLEYPNKVIYRNGQNPSESLTYYWHPSDYSGTVDTNQTGVRVFPVVQRAKVVEPEEATEESPAKTFQQVAYADAVNTMYQSKYDDQIEITYNTSSKLVAIGQIGQLYMIVDNEKMYQTVLTGYRRLNDKHTLLTLGFSRSRLTQILKIERRNS